MWKFLLRLFSKNTKNEFGFGTGLKPQPGDKRDYEEPLGAAPFDWSKGYDIEHEMSQAFSKAFKIPVHNQDGSSSCVAQAWTTYGSIKNYFETGKWVKASARDMYSNIWIGFGGAYLRDGGKRYIKSGVLPEHELPSYDNGNPPSETFMRKKARKSKMLDNLRQVLQGKEYRLVSLNTIDDFAKAIAVNGGVVFGVNGENNGTWASTYPKIPDKYTWRHAIYGGKVVMRNGKKYIGILNSWGMVGEEGWQYLGEEWFTSRNVFDGWALSDQPNHIENEKDYEEITTFIKSTGYKPPMKGMSPYHSKNWSYITNQTGFNYSAGQHYDYSQAKKLREEYDI